MKEVDSVGRWNSKSSTKKLPSDIREKFVLYAKCLLIELNECKNEYILIEAPDKKFDSHKIWAKYNKSPDWYLEMYCARNPIHRRDRTIRALQRIKNRADGNHGTRRFVYDFLIRELIKDRLLFGYESQFEKIEPDHQALDYFGIESEQSSDWEERDDEHYSSVFFDFEIEETPF